MNRRNRGKSQPQRGKKSFKKNVKSSKFTPKRKSKLRLNKSDAKEIPSTESLGKLQATATTTTTTATAVTTTTSTSIASKEAVNQHVMTARLLEKDVGITEYISKHEGFSGIIKQRFSDFHVNEIDIDGNVVILTSTSVPELPVDVDEAKKAEDYLKDAVSKDSLEKLKQLLESRGDDSVEIEVSDMSKEDRRKIHMAILKYGLRRLNSNTKERDGKKYITVSAKPDRRVSWPSERGGEYVQFVLHKENMDTMETVNDIAGKLRVKPNLIGYAGTKDRRAKTSQLMSIRRVEPSKLAKSTRNLRGVTLGNYTFKDSGLKLGQLCGNRFRIVLRNVTGKDVQIKEAMTSLEEKGFINYFGLQRFGNSLVIPTYEIGRAILQTKWKEAVELILKPRDGEQMRDLSEARKVWWETRDAARALKLLRNPNKHIEGKLLEALSNLGPNNYCDALNKLPNNALSLYMHAYQSLLWNKVVSRRISEFGLHALAGDLVPKEGSAKAAGDDPAVEEDALNVTGSSEETSFSKKDDVREIGEKELTNIKIEDIVVPLPGYDITYPNNVTGEWMQELLKKDGLESMSFRKTLKHFKVGGTYRRLVIRPTNVKWKVMRYSDPQTALLLSDLEMMQNVPAPRDDPDGAYKALVLEFHLPSSCYATMALREILKTDTSVSLQASLNDYHIPKAASKSKENGAEGLGESVTNTLENGSASQEGPSKMKTRRNSSQKSESPSLKGKGKVISEGDKTRQEESRASIEECTSSKKTKSSESATNKVETSVKTKGKRTAEHFDAAVLKPKETLKKPKTVENSSQKLEETSSVKTRAKRSSDHLDHSASETEDAKEEKKEVDDVSNKKVRSENDSAPVKTRGRTTPKHVETAADSEEASSGAEEPVSGKKTRSKSKLRDISEGETIEHEDISKTRSRAKIKLRENIEDMRTEAEDNTPIRTRSKGREVSDGNKIPEEAKTEHEDSVPDNPSVRTRSKFREAPVDETKLEGEEVIPCNASLRTRSKAREIPEGGKINDEMKFESEDTTRENPSIRTRSKVREVSDGNKTAEEVKIESDEGAPENLPVRTRSKVREASEGSKSNDEPKLDSEENAPVRTRSKAMTKSRDSTSESEGTKDDDLLKNKSERSATPSRAESSEDKPSVRTRSRAISKLADSPALESEGGTEDEDTSSAASSPYKAKLPVRTRSKAKYRDSSLSDNDSAKVEPANSAEEGSSSVRTRSRIQSKLRDSPALDTDGSRDSIEGPDTSIGPVRTRSRISSRSRDSPAPEKLAEDSKQDISESVEERPSVKTRTRSSSKASETVSPHSGDNGDEKLQVKRDDQKIERNLAINENSKKEKAELERDNKRIKLDESVKKSGKILQSEKNKVKEERNENVEDQRRKLSADNNRASNDILGSKETEEGNGCNEPPSLELLGGISLNSEDGVKVQEIRKVLCENNEMKDAPRPFEGNASKGAMEGLSTMEVDSSLGESQKKLEENQKYDELKMEVISTSKNHETDLNLIPKITEGGPELEVSEDSRLESAARNLKQNLASNTNLLSNASDDSSALVRSVLANKTEIKKDQSEVEISANQNEEKLVNVDKTKIKNKNESEVEISANQNEDKLVNVHKTEIKKDGSESEVEISANQNEEKLVNVDKTEIKEDKSESEVEISVNHNEEKLVNVEIHSEKVVDHKFEPQTKDAAPKLGDSNTETIVAKELSQVDVTHELNGSLSEKVDSSPINTNCKPDTSKSDVIKSYSDIELQKSETCAGNKYTENACKNVNNEITSASSDVSSSLTETVSQNKDSYVLENTCEEKMHHEDSKDSEVSTKDSCLKETENEENTKIVSASLLGATAEVTGETCHPPKMSDDQKELENKNIHEEETSVKGNNAPEQKETVNSGVKIRCETVGEYHYQNKPVVEKTDNATGKEQSDGNKIELGEDGFNLRRELEKATEDQSISESLCHVQSSHGQKTDDSAVKQSIAAEAAVSSLKTDSHASQDDREVAVATEDTCSGSLLLESKDISRPVDENSGSDLVVKNDEVPSGFINTICDDILPRNIECSFEKDDSKQEKDDDASVLKHEPLNNKNLKHLAEREEKTDVLNETDLIGPCEADSVRKSETLEERLETSVAKAKTDFSMETEIFSTETVGSGACFSELVKPQDGDVSDATELVENNTSKINVCEQKSRVEDESFAKSSKSTETIGSTKAECDMIHPKETVDSTVSEKSEGCIVGDELLHKPISKAADRQGDIAEGTVLSSSSKPVQLLNEDKSDEIVEDKVATSHHDETITKITNALDRKFDSTFSAQDLPMTETRIAMGDDVHVRSERNEQNVTCESNQQAELEEKIEERLDKNESLNVSINSNQHHLKLSLGTEADSNKSEIKLTEMETNQLKILPVEESCDDRTHGKETGMSSEPSQSMRQDDCPSVLDKGMEIHGIDATKDKMEDGNSVGGRCKGNILEETHSAAELECLQTVTTTACHSEVQNESVEIESTAAIVRSNETVQVGNNGEIFSKDISDREHDSGESASLANEADTVMDVCRGKSPTLKNHDVGAGGTHTEVSKHKLVAISNVNVSESVQEVKKLDTSCSTEKSMAPIVTAVACNNEEIMAGLDVKSTPKIKLSKEICIKIDGDNVSGTEEIIQENISVRALAEESAEADLSKLKKVTSFTVTESLVEPISPAEPTVSETEPELVSFPLKEVIDPEKLQDVVNSNTLCESRSPKQKAEVDSLIVEKSKKESSGVRSVDLTIEKEKPDTMHSIGFSTDNPTETVEKSLSVETYIEKDSSNNSELEKNSTFMTSPDARVTGKEHVMIEIRKASDMQIDQPGDETVLVSTDTVDDRQINSISEEASDISEELRAMGQDTSLPLAAEISMPLQSAELVDKKGASPIEGTFLHEPEKSSGNTDGNERVISLTEKSEHAIENKDEMLVSVDLGEHVAEPQERLEGTGDVKEEEILSSVTETPKEISCISEVATATSEDLNSKGDTEESVLFSKGYHLPETEQKAVLKSSEVVHLGSETETGTTEPSVEFEKEVKGASLKLSESEKERKLVHQHLEVTSSATEVAHEDKNLGTTTTRETECLTVQSVDLPVERTLAPSVKLSKSPVNANDIIAEEENVKEIESTGLFENVGKIEKTSSEDSDDRAEVTTPTMRTDFSNDMEVYISSELHDGALKLSSSSDAAEMTEILKPVSNFSEVSLANCKTRLPAEELEEKQEIEETDESKLSLECSKVVGVDKITSSEKLLQGTKMDEAGKISELTVVNTSNSDEGVFVSMPKVAEKEDATITVPLVAYNMEAVPKVSETEECLSKGQVSEISDETSGTETPLSSNSLGNKLEENSRSMGLKPEGEGVLERKGNISPLEILSVKEIIHPEESVVIKDAVNAEDVGMSKTNVETLIHQTTSSEKMEESFTPNSQERSIKDCEDASLGKCQRLEKIKLSKVLQSVKENRNGNSCSEQCHTKNITVPQNGEELKTLESMAGGSLGECSESVGNGTYSKEQEGVEELKEVTSSEYATAVTESVMETAMLPEHTDVVNQEDVSSKQHGDTLLDWVERGTMEMGKVIPTKQCDVSRAEEIAFSEQNEESVVETKLLEESKFTKKGEAVLSEQSGIQTDEPVSSEQHEATQTKDINVSEQTNICQMKGVKLHEKSRILHANTMSSQHPESPRTEETKTSREIEEGVPSEQPMVIRTEEDNHTAQTEETMAVGQSEVTRLKDAIGSEEIVFAEAKETIFSELSSDTQKKVGMPSEQHDISQTFRTKLSEHIEANQVETTPEQNGIALSEESSKQNEIPQVEETKSSAKAIPVQMEEILPPDQTEDLEIAKNSCDPSEITRMERAMSAKQCDVSHMEGVKSPEQCEVASQENGSSHGKSVIATVENVLIDATMLSGRGINKLENTKPPKHDTVVLEEENQCIETGMDGSLSPEQEISFSSKNLEVRKVTESIPFEQNKLPHCDKIEPSEKCKINRLEEVVSSEQDEASHEREIVSSKQCEVNQVDNSAPIGQIEEHRMKEATLSEQNAVIQKEESLYAEECKVTHVKEDLTSEEHKAAIQEKIIISESCSDLKMPEIMPSEQCSDTRSGGNHSFESTQIKFLPPGKLDQQENPEIEEDTSVEQKENCTSECLDTPCVDIVSEQHMEKKLLFCKQGDASSKRSASCELPVIQEECISSKRRKLSLAEAVEAGVSSQEGEISPMKQEPYEQHSSDLQKLATQSVTSQSHVIVEEVSSTEKPIIQREMSVSSESNEIAEMEESLSSDQCKVTSSEDISVKHKVCKVGTNQLCKKGEVSVSKFPDHEVQKKGNQVDEASCIEQSEFFQSEKNSEQSDVILAVEDNEPEVMHVTEGISSIEQSRTSSEVEETKPQKSTGESSEQPASSQIGGKLSESITAYQCLKESISSEKIEGSLTLKETESTEQAAVLTKRSASELFDVSEGIEAPSFSDQKTETLQALEDKSSSEPTDVCNEREASSSSEQSAILVRIEESSSLDLHKVSEGMEESLSVKQPEVSERMEDSSVKQPEILEGMEESSVRQVEFFEKMEESSVEELEVPEGMEESSLEQAKVMQTEDSLSSKQPEILQSTDKSSLEQHNDLHRVVESSSDQPNVLQKMESSSSEQAVVFQEVKELVCSELPDVQKEEESSAFAQPVVLQRKEESTLAEKHEVMKKEESTSFEQPEVLPFVEESKSSKKPEVLQRQEESVTAAQLEILTVAEESSSSNQPEILSRIEDSLSSEQPEVLQRAESSISSSQPEVLQEVEESASSDPPNFVQEMEESLASEQPEVLERLEESSCSNQTEFLQRMEESSCSDQPKVLERMEESPYSDQPEVLQRMEQSSCSDQPEVLQRLEESSCCDQPEVLQKMEGSSFSGQPEVLQKMEESSSLGHPEVSLRREEQSSPGQTKVLQRMEESSSLDQPKVMNVEDQSTSDQPKVMMVEDQSTSDQPEVLQKAEESSSSGQPEALQRVEKSSSSDQPSVLQKMDDSSCSSQPEVLQRMDESSCCKQPEFLQKIESSSLDQPKISEKVEELSSSDQPSVLQMVEESSSVDQPEVSQRVEESSVDQPEVSQRVEESSVDQPEISQRVEESSSMDQPEVSQRVEESSSMDQPEVSQRVEESSMDQPEVSQRVEESFSMDQPEVSQRVEESSSMDQPEVSQRVEESSMDQPEVSQRVEESFSMDQPEVSQRVEESSSIDQPEVSQRVEESSSMDQPKVSQRVDVSSSMDQPEVSQGMEDSSSMDQPEVSQRMEESSAMDQPEVSQRMEESSAMDQPEVSQRMEESSAMDQPEVSQRMEESSAMDQPEVSQRVGESSSMDQPEVSQRVEESSSMNQPEVSQRVEESSMDQPEVSQRVEESSSMDQPEVSQRMEESSAMDQPEVSQRVGESSSMDQPEVSQRVEESSSMNQPEVSQRVEESSMDQPEVSQRVEESSSMDQPEVSQRVEESSSVDQPKVLQRVEESSVDQPEVSQKVEDSSVDQPEVSQRMEESSSMDQPEVSQRVEESSVDQPEVSQRVEESMDQPEVSQRVEESSMDQPEVSQRVEESSMDQPEVSQRVEESSSMDHPEVSHRVEESSSMDQPEVSQRMEESSMDQPEVTQRMEESLSMDQPEVSQRVGESSSVDQPEVSQRVEESSSMDQPEVSQRVEESSSMDQPEVSLRVEESSSSKQTEVSQRVEESSSSEQPEVLQRVEESSPSEQPEVLQRVEESSSDQPKVLQRMEELPSSQQPEILQRIEQSSSSEQPEILQKIEESPAVEEANILQQGEDSSPLNRPEISQRMEESSASEQHKIVHRIEDYHPEVLHRIEESSTLEQPKVLQRPEKSLPSEQPNVLQSIRESSFPGHFEVSQRMEKSSTSEQPEVLGRTEESSLEQSLILGRTQALSSSEQPDVLGLMEDSSTSEQPKVLQRIEESLSSKQPTILQRKEEKPPSEQSEIFQRLEESSSPEQPEILQRKKEMPSTEQPQVLQKMEEFSQKIESSSLVLPVVKSSEQGEVSVIESSDKPEVFDKDSSEQLKILERIESSSELPDVSKKTEKFSSTAESEVLKRDGTSISSNLDKMFRPLPTLEHPKVSMTEELQSSNKSDVCIVLEEPVSSPKQSEDVLAIKDERKSGTLETFSTSPAVLSESCKESEDSSLGKPECSSLAKDPEPVLGCNISAVPTVPSEQSEGTVGILEHPKTGDEIEKTMALPEKSEDSVTEVELQVFKEGTCVDKVLSEKNGPVYSDISVVNNEATQSNEMFQKCETSKVNEDIKSCELSETVEKVEFVASSESSKTDKETKLSKSSFTSRTSDSEQNEVINLIEKVILPEKPQSVEKMNDGDLSEHEVSEVELKTLFSRQQCDVTAATQSGQLENSDIKAEDGLSKKVVTTVKSEKPSQTLDQMALSERLGDISPVPEIEKSGKQEANEHNEPQILDSIEVHKVAEISLSDGKKEDGVLCKSLEIHVGEEKKQTLNAKENLDSSILGKVTETVSSPNFNSDFESLGESCTAEQNSMLSSKAVESNDNVSTASQEEKFAISNSHANSVQDVRDNLEGVEQLSANKTQHCSTKELTNKQEENLKCNESDTHSTGTSLDASQPNSGRSAESKELLTSETDPLKSILPGDVGTKEFDSISANSNDTKLELAVKRKADQDDGSSQDGCQITTKKVRLPTEDNEQQLQEVPAKRKADDVDNARSEENKRVRLGETTVTGEDNEEESEECVLKRKSLEVNCDGIEAKKAKLEATDAPE